MSGTDRVKEAEKVARRSRSEGAARASAAKLRMTEKSMMIEVGVGNLIGIGRKLMDEAGNGIEQMKISLRDYDQRVDIDPKD